MENYPGQRPMHCDAVQLTSDLGWVEITGKIVSQGVFRDGRGFVELTLPDADPEQQRELERAQWYHYELYLGAKRLYWTPQLKLHEMRRTKTGALVVVGAPA